MSKVPTIPYLSGFDVKPSSTSVLGVVTFTDGRNDITPNQLQCEAYGYTYNKATGTCSTFRYNTNLDRNFNNINNKVEGAGNTAQTGTNNTYIIGENNTVRGLSRNNIVVGNNNEIANSVNNAFVYGTKGEATADNSIVLGGNAAADLLAERQSIQLLYGTQSTTSGTVASYLNNTAANFFEIPENTAMYFHGDVIALRVGGSSGSGAVGDFASWVVRGVIINKSGTLSISTERDAIKSSGIVTNWRPTAVASATHFGINVRGQTNMTLEWASTINFTQIKTSVAL